MAGKSPESGREEPVSLSSERSGGPAIEEGGELDRPGPPQRSGGPQPPAIDLSVRLGSLLGPLAPYARPLRGAAVAVLGLVAVLGYGRFLGGYYAVKDWLFWRLLALWGWGALLSLGCAGFGAAAISRLPSHRDLPVLEQLVLSAAIGLVGFCLGMFAGGALSLYGPVFAVALPLSMALSGALPLVRLARRGLAARASAPPETPLTALAGGFGVLCVALVYLQVMTPDAINFDASWCHLTVGADYARAGKIIPFFGDYARTVPHLASFVHTWAFLVPGLSEPLRWMLALHDEFFFFLWMLAGVAACARWMLDDEPARRSWAVFFLFPAIFVYDNNMGGAADHFLAFFTPPLFLACARAGRRMELTHWALIGVFAAGAIMTKYQATYALFGAGLLAGGAVVFHAVKRWRGDADAPAWRALVMGPAAAIVAGLVLSSPQFLKNWIFYKNPVYPFAQDVFTGSTPTTPNAAFLFEYLFKDWNWRPHGTLLERLTSSAKLTFLFSFEPHYAFLKKFPITGSLFTLCLPILPFVWRQRRIWAGVLAGMGALFLWAMTFRVDRNLQIIMPILAAVTAATLVRAWQLGWVARVGVVPLVALQLIWGGDAMFYSGQERLKSAIDLIRGGYDGKREERFAYRKEFKELEKALPPDAVVIIHNYRPNLGINRKIVMDWAGQQGLFLYEGLKSARELYDYWRARGVTHVLHIPGRHAASTRAEDVLFEALVRRYGIVKRVRGWEVVELRKTPPPEEAPYQVLTVGLGGYRDGLYPVEALQTYEALPKHLLAYPAPPEPLPAGPAGRELLARAEAVLVGKSAKLDPAVSAELGQAFVQAVSYSKAFALHLRKTAGAEAPQDALPPKRSVELGGAPPLPDLGEAEDAAQ